MVRDNWVETTRVARRSAGSTVLVFLFFELVHGRTIDAIDAIEVGGVSVQNVQVLTHSLLLLYVVLLWQLTQAGVQSLALGGIVKSVMRVLYPDLTTEALDDALAPFGAVFLGGSSNQLLAGRRLGGYKFFEWVMVAVFWGALALVGAAPFVMGAQLLIDDPRWYSWIVVVVSSLVVLLVGIYVGLTALTYHGQGGLAMGSDR
jgi:hypothetical protein